MSTAPRTGEERSPSAGRASTAAPPSGREAKILGIIETARGKRAKFRDERVNMAHGAGGKATQGMIEGLFLPAFGGEALEDAGAVEVDGVELALTTDSFVVKPIRFPGGSIGDLAVNGTVNDLAVSGARPLALSLSLILEEGLGADDLKAEVESIAQAAEAAEVQIITGDTKVVERGAADQMYICTTGMGRRDPRARLAADAIRPGDRILLSGTIGEHGTAIMLARGEFELAAEIESDTRSLWPVADALLEEAGPVAALHARRHPRRRRLRAERAGSRFEGRDARERGGGADRARGRRRVGDPGDRPHVRGERGQAGRLRGAGGCGSGARRAALGPGM